MKIIMITAFFHPVMGGAENHVLWISEQLTKKGHEVEVWTSNLTRDEKIKEEESIISSVKIKRFKTWFRYGDFGSFFPSLFIKLKKTNADIVHVHAYRHIFNLACYFTKAKKIITPHWPNYPKGVRKNKWLDFAANIMDKTIGKIILNKYNKVFAVTGTEINWLKKFNIPDSKIEITPNGIPSQYLKQRKGISFRKKYNISKNEKLILCLSRIHKSKGLDQVVKIAKYFQKERFIIIGKDEGFLTELNLLIKKDNLKNVNIIGQVSEEEKLQAYKAADIFIHPSHYEAFGIVVLEAMSQGCPVISSNQGGLPWAVGDAGLIFEDLNLEDLRQKLSLLLSNKELRKKLSKIGKNRAKNFTWEEISTKVEKIYQDLLAPKNDF